MIIIVNKNKYIKIDIKYHSFLSKSYLILNVLAIPTAHTIAVCKPSITLLTLISFVCIHSLVFHRFNITQIRNIRNEIDSL